MQVGLQAGTTLHDLKGTVRDAPQQLRTLWVGARFPSGGIRSPRGTITWRDTRPDEQSV